MYGCSTVIIPSNKKKHIDNTKKLILNGTLLQAIDTRHSSFPYRSLISRTDALYFNVHLLSYIFFCNALTCTLMKLFYWFGVSSKKLMIITYMYLDNKGDVNQINLEQQNTAKYQLFDGL